MGQTWKCSKSRKKLFYLVEFLNVVIEVCLIDEDVVAESAFRKRVFGGLQMVAHHVAEDPLVRSKLDPTDAADRLARLRRDFRGRDEAGRRLRQPVHGR